jgi:catechol 2,3-dioxygenase-like lactoylglutathione lyase family enzyme
MLMPDTLNLGPVHHTAITVRDMEVSTRFYTQILGLTMVGEFGPKRIFANEQVMIGMGPATNTDPALIRFDEGRVGLDHLSFGVASRADLETALTILDAHGVPHGEITDIPEFGISILAFRDPDNIQLELTAPYG